MKIESLICFFFSIFNFRALSRKAFGKMLAEQGVVRREIAASRQGRNKSIFVSMSRFKFLFSLLLFEDIEQARLLVLSAASTLDRVGNRNAR